MWIKYFRALTMGVSRPLGGIRLFFVCLLIFCSSCKSHKALTTNTSEHLQTHEEQTIKSSSPQIVFLGFKISSNQHNSLEVILEEKLTGQGRLKDLSDETRKPTNGDLMVLLTDETGKIIRREIIENPLNPRIEFVQDDGVISQTTLHLETAGFSFRFNSSPQIKRIKIYLYKQAGATKLYDQDI